jgi:hypothetical protein
MNRSWAMTLGLAACLSGEHVAWAEPQVLTPRLHHLRQGPQPEWADFPKQADGASLALPFLTNANNEEWTLRIRHQDVRETWKVLVNGKQLGKLALDENDTTIALAVPPGTLREGDNTLKIEQLGKAVDDIRVGEIALDPRPLAKHLGEATVEIDVREGKEPTPCRITILDAKGSLATLQAASDAPLAVRPGVVYAGAGRARFTLPAGAYTIYAGRGFEYSVASVQAKLQPGDSIRRSLTIRREVPTEGWICCDTHVHTLTFSGHGDATQAERMLTLAGEGLELPIATDHNCHIDHHAAAVKAGVRRYFTPVVGNEFTTPVGHFNLFPLRADLPAPAFKHKDWAAVAGAIEPTGAKVVILNHARDIFAGFRAFGTYRHLALTGEDLDDWKLPANAMEVVNSGAQQSDPMQLIHDWLGMLSGGHFLTPVGSSDAHDVCRYIVGQGRTYIRGDDGKPGEIDVAAALDSFVRGRVNVSCGLLTEMTINGVHGPGDLVPACEEMKVAVRVLGPSWVKAETIALYANGVKIREAKIGAGQGPGVHWQETWTLPAPRHDVHYVAVAAGPGVRELYWPLGKPYQATSPIDNRRIIGVTGAVWLDGDGDGQRSSAFDYAKRLIGSPADIGKLAPYDEAVAAQAARVLRRQGVMPSDAKVVDAARKAGRHVEQGFEAYATAWRASQVAERPTR